MRFASVADLERFRAEAQAARQPKNREIVVSADFREWRHIFKLRLSPKAQWEIRKACTKMLAILKDRAPACFEDILTPPV